MGSQRLPNEALRALLTEAGWTGDVLARAVNAVGAEAGLTLRYQRASVAHQHAAVSACLGDQRDAAAALARSVRHRPATERRSRAITLAGLAELHWADGHLEPACHSWHSFLDIYPSLRSQRAATALATLRAATRPHQQVPAVRALRQRAAAQGTTWVIQS